MVGHNQNNRNSVSKFLAGISIIALIILCAKLSFRGQQENLLNEVETTAEYKQHYTKKEEK